MAQEMSMGVVVNGIQGDFLQDLGQLPLVVRSQAQDLDQLAAGPPAGSILE
jgi:hypothetical protein